MQKTNLKINVKLRQANLNDLKEMQRLFVETIKASCKGDYNNKEIDAWITSVDDKQRWNSAITNQFFLVAESNGKIVGYGSLERGSYLDFIYVHKECQRQGVANLLYENLKKESVRLGFSKLISDVSKTARPFFEAKGFHIMSEKRNIINGVEVINYHMTQ